MAGASGYAGWVDVALRYAGKHKPFSDYYQHGRSVKPAKPKTEPKTKRELKGHMEGSHSPFGFIMQIASQTGWSVHYIMWKVPYTSLLLMMMDMPHWVDEEESTGDPRKTPGKSNTVAMFENRLNNK